MFNELKEQVKTAKDAVSRAEGALEQHLKTLKDEFNCDTVEEAEEMLGKMTDELVGLEEEAETLLTDFEAKWKEQLST
jgi:ribosome recycling factor